MIRAQVIMTHLSMTYASNVIYTPFALWSERIDFCPKKIIKGEWSCEKIAKELGHYKTIYFYPDINNKYFPYIFMGYFASCT